MSSLGIAALVVALASLCISLYLGVGLYLQIRLFNKSVRTPPADAGKAE